MNFLRSGSVTPRVFSHRHSAVPERGVLRGLEFAAIVIAALVAAVPAVLTTPHVNYDSESYLAPLSLTAERLPVVPAIYALLGHDLTAIVVTQALIGVACWSYLAYAALRVTHRPWCYVSFIGVLAISCSDYVTHWYDAILSDSISLSLLALLLGSFSFWLSRQASLAQVIIVAWLWAFTRDTNGYIVLLIGLVALVVILVRRRTIHDMIAPLAAIFAGVLVLISTDTGSLWMQPFLHVTSERILVDPSRVAWFAAHGMPVSPTLLHLAGPYYPATDNALRHSTALASWRQWMVRSGERTYLEYAILHPWWMIKGTFGAHQELTRAGLDYYGGTALRPWLPGFVKDLFLSYRQTTLILFASSAGVMLMVRRRLLRVEGRALLWWGALTVAGAVNLVLDWVGDSWEIGRHSVDATVQIAVCSLFLISIGLGAADRARRRPGPGTQSVVPQRTRREDARS